MRKEFQCSAAAVQYSLGVMFFFYFDSSRYLTSIRFGACAVLTRRNRLCAGFNAVLCRGEPQHYLCK
jgi:hypothetical protein